MITRFALDKRLVMVSAYQAFAADGGLLVYAANIAEIISRAASYVDRILRGANPADLPIEEPRRFDLVVNLRTARALGLTIPPSLLLLADQVIE